MNISIHGIYHEKPVRQIKYCLDGIRKSLLNSWFHDQTINHNLNIVFDILIQTDLLGEFVHISINLHTDIATSLRMFKKLGMSSLATSYYRSQQLNLCSLRKRHDAVYHLINCLFLNLSAAFRTVWDSDSRIQQSEIIINFRYSSYCGTWIAVGRFLID